MRRSISWPAGWRWASLLGRGWGLASLAAVIGGPPALGQCYEQQKLTASDADQLDNFGISVALSGDVAVVGTKGDDCAAGTSCGSAYVYRNSGATWVEEQKLAAPDADAGDQFGISVSLDGDVAVVGVWRDDCAAGSDCGSVYVYRCNGSAWVEEQKLAASDAAQGDYFGHSVSVSGDVAVVGASGDDCVAHQFCGSAYVFRFNGTTWVQQQKLTAAAAQNGFGGAVSVDGNVAVVGAYGDGCAAGPRCGSAYVFRNNGSTWLEEKKLTASDATRTDEFGWSVSLSGDVALVGAHWDDCTSGNDCGSAYVYRHNGTTWVQEQKLSASDASSVDEFGRSVSVHGGVAIVGAFLDDCTAGFDCGSAYAYRYNGSAWVDEQKLYAGEAAELAQFGTSVSISGDVALVGAAYDSWFAGAFAGSAYFYTLVPRVYGDVHPPGGNGIVDLDDILCVVDGFSAAALCPPADLLPCEGNGVIDLDDIFAVLDAFAGTAACPAPCP